MREGSVVFSRCLPLKDEFPHAETFLARFADGRFADPVGDRKSLNQPPWMIGTAVTMVLAVPSRAISSIRPAENIANSVGDLRCGA
jgi:hypothetical protein